jgi:hypothetical protein
MHLDSAQSDYRLVWCALLFALRVGGVTPGAQPEANHEAQTGAGKQTENLKQPNQHTDKRKREQAPASAAESKLHGKPRQVDCECKPDAPADQEYNCSEKLPGCHILGLQTVQEWGETTMTLNQIAKRLSMRVYECASEKTDSSKVPSARTRADGPCWYGLGRWPKQPDDRDAEQFMIAF